jgi:hypothetical protein
MNMSFVGSFAMRFDTAIMRQADAVTALVGGQAMSPTAARWKPERGGVVVVVVVLDVVVEDDVVVDDDVVDDDVVVAPVVVVAAVVVVVPAVVVETAVPAVTTSCGAFAPVWRLS